MFEAVEVGSEVGREEFEAQLPDLRVALLNAQYDLREADFPVIALLAGDDRPGCSEVLHTLNEWMDARYLHTHAFGAPSDEERERPPFWRIWRALPARGELAILFGAWAPAMIAARLDGRLDEAGFERQLEHAARFQETQVGDGALFLKFWLHLPEKELRKRMRKSKLRAEDEAAWRVFENGRGARALAERLISHTESAQAPWTLVESRDDRHRDLVVARTLLAALESRLAQAEKAKAHEAVATPARISTPPSEVVTKSNVLESVDLSKTIAYDEYKQKLNKLQARLASASARMREDGGSAVLVFEGWDAAGKGGSIRRITTALDARDYRVVPIGAPTDEELAHHYLWRFWRQLARAGRIQIFDRSWYGRVLVERVEGFAAPEDWRRAYSEINAFEEQLVDHGTVVLKFWLHIDSEEQLRRFKAREQTPYKKHKITADDYRNRERWRDYEAAVDEMVARTSTTLAPWHLVAANDKRWARTRVLEILVKALKKAQSKD